MDKKINTSEKISDKETEKKLEKKKKTSERCYYCNKKLKIIHFTCKCNHKFCVVHQNPHSHNCEFNNKKLCQEKLKLNNPQMIHQKVVKI
tara:strand:+ start:4453 stop:4722 length:270 start_codon:yes stop_codon:yes gene_type:complete